MRTANCEMRTKRRWALLSSITLGAIFWARSFLLMVLRMSGYFLDPPLHSDACGPMHITSYGSARYLLTFLDYHSRMTVTYFIKNKYKLLEKFKEYLKMTQNFTGKKLKRLRSADGGEYISEEFNNFCKEQGIIQEPTIPGTPHQNVGCKICKMHFYRICRSTKRVPDV